MSEMVFDSCYPFTNISSYFSTTGKIFAREIRESKNYLEETERLIYELFLTEHRLQESIKDIDIFFLALGEVVENFVEYQIIRLKKKPNIIIEYGLDPEKIIISVRDELGEEDFSSLFQSFIRKTSLSQPGKAQDYKKSLPATSLWKKFLIT